MLAHKVRLPKRRSASRSSLYERGLGCYGVYEVCNSSWFRSITAQNRVAFPQTSDSAQRHFTFTFHDSTFECVTRGLRVSLSTKPYAEIFEDIKKRVFQL